MLKKLSSVMLFFVVLTFFSPLAFSSWAKPTMIYPVDSFTLTSPFGWRVHPITGQQKFHSGVDLGGDYGDTVRAALGGIVTDACWIRGYGYTVIIDHGNGYSTLYGHNQKFLVWEGKKVKQGEPIAEMGSTGNSTGPHCHFEVRVNGNVDNPGKYIPGLESLQVGQFGKSSGWGTDFDDKPKVLEISEDFAKPLRDFAEKIGKIFETAVSAIKDLVWQIFIMLAIIDFAISAMYKTLDDNNDESFTSWFLYKLIFLGFLMYFFSYWGEFVGGVALNGFPALGAMAAGSTLEETGKILSDPTLIVQKGLHLTVPLINEAMKLDAPFSITDYILSSLDPREQIIEAICLVFGGALFLAFFVIGIQLILVYVYFYSSILFAFTGFMFSSLKQTRKYASNGINGIFASSLMMMFFCLFAVMLNFSMEKLTMQNIISTELKTEEIGATEEIKSIEELMVRIKFVESSGRYYVDNGLGYFGAYQIDYKGYKNWQRWTEDYVKSGGHLETGPVMENEPCGPAWTPANQDNIARFILTGFYNKYGSYEMAARCWNQGEGGRNNADADEYAEKVLNAKGKSEWESRTLAVWVLIQLAVLVFMFIFIADKISKLINKTFGGMGFRLTNDG